MQRISPKRIKRRSNEREQRDWNRNKKYLKEVAVLKEKDKEKLRSRNRKKQKKINVKEELDESWKGVILTIYT